MGSIIVNTMLLNTLATGFCDQLKYHEPIHKGVEECSECTFGTTEDDDHPQNG